MTAVAEIVVAAAVEPWSAIGLRIDEGVACVGGIGLRFEPAHVDVPAAIAAWTLLDSPSRPSDIDGLATRHVDGIDPCSPVAHPLGVVSFDHLVVMTSSLERTCGAIERATGEPLKRVREAGAVRQGFHRLGALVIEVVESGRHVAEFAGFWGFVFVVDDIESVCARLGPEQVSPPKAAVQPGRLIASFRSGAGLGLPIALMSPLMSP